MSNYNHYITKLSAASVMLHEITRLKCMIANMEQNYKLWCNNVDLPAKYRRLNQIEMDEEIYKAREIHEERRETKY